MASRSSTYHHVASCSILCTLILLAVALAGCEPQARDGTAPAEPAAPEASAVVTYAFDVPAPPGELSPSAPLVAELAQDPNLGRLTVSGGSASEASGGRAVEAEFAFGTVADFLAWREQPQTRALLASIAALSPDTVAFQPTLSVRRPALYRSIVGRVERGASSGGRTVESVACNEDCSQIDVRYRTRANEAGGAAPGQGTGDAGDIDAVTLVCQPGLAGTIEECKASN